MVLIAIIKIMLKAGQFLLIKNSKISVKGKNYDAK